MQEQFFIKSDHDLNSELSNLVILVGADYFAYAVHHTGDNSLVELKRYSFPKTDTVQLNATLEQNAVLHQSFQKIITAFDFDTNTLLPLELNTGDNSPLLYLNEADPQDHIISEVINERQVANLYSVPYSMLNWILTHFPSSVFWHLKSVQIKNAPDDMSCGCMNIDFGENKFNVTAVDEGKLLLSRSFVYKTPADALFYLLKICEAFNLKQEVVQLNISGLIDRNSGMFKILYEYFLNINLLPATWVQASEYPLHYFTVLNQLSLCEL